MKTFAYVVRRVFAFGTDWYISAVLINLMTNAIGHFTSGEYSVHIALAIASLLVAFLYYVLVPLKVWKGQTLMMRAMHFEEGKRCICRSCAAQTRDCCAC